MYCDALEDEMTAVIITPHEHLAQQTMQGREYLTCSVFNFLIYWVILPLFLGQFTPPFIFVIKSLSLSFLGPHIYQNIPPPIYTSNIVFLSQRYGALS